MKQQTQTNKTKWKDVKLEDICDTSGGGTPSRTKAEYWKGEIPWLKISNLKEFYVTKYDETITKEGLNNSSAKLFKKGTILISIFASLGDVAILDIDATTNQAIAGIYNLKENINREYLALFLKSLKPYFEKIGRGVAQNNINLSILRNTKVKLPFLPDGTPDLKEQERIVKILEENERQLKRADRAEELLNEYLKSVFNEMFYNKGFEIKKIRDVLEYSQYGTSMKSNSERKGYKVLGMNSITYDGHIDISKHNYVDITKEEYNKLKLENGDIIFNRTNSKELVGKTAYWNLNENVVLASYLVKLRLKKIINPIFFTYLLNTNKYKKLFEMRSRKAVNQANLSPTLLKEFEVMLPPLPLQQKFSRIVEQVEKMKENVNKTKQNAEELFNSLMQKAFKGELD